MTTMLIVFFENNYLKESYVNPSGLSNVCKYEKNV